ncbi:hypothetical protein M0802_009655 [Mischocyttarus mexicanus]|nr:hypothetical protein M0802_009655 [Mischocyttarus mexicanus]
MPFNIRDLNCERNRSETRISFDEHVQMIQAITITTITTTTTTTMSNMKHILYAINQFNLCQEVEFTLVCIFKPLTSFMFLKSNVELGYLEIVFFQSRRKNKKEEEEEEEEEDEDRNFIQKTCSILFCYFGDS